MDHFDKTRNDHSDFLKGELNNYLADPILMFQKWYQLAYEKNCPSPNAMVISTVNQNGQPSSRIVYMKELIEEGLIFFTNYNSKKGEEIALNSKVGGLFFWENNEQQVRIEGVASKIDPIISDDYFNSRPRISQIGAWASDQSQDIKNRVSLEERVAFFEKKYPNIVPRPPHWGGYIIKPNYFEFWQGRLGRLHDRICYTQFENNWKIKRIAP